MPGIKNRAVFCYNNLLTLSSMEIYPKLMTVRSSRLYSGPFRLLRFCYISPNAFYRKSGFLLFLLCSGFCLSAQTLVRFERNKKYGFRDESNKVVVSPIYDYATDTIRSLGGVSNKDGWAVINNKGQVLTDFIYKGGVGNSNGFDLVPVTMASGFMNVNQYHGIVNKYGKEVVTPHYSFVEIQSNDLAVVDDYGKYGIINSSGQLVLPLQYSKETLVVYKNIQPNGTYYQNGQWKAFSFDGNTIRKWKYDNIIVQGEYMWPVKYNNKWGYVDATGREVVGASFDSVGIFSGGIAWVANNGKKGVIGINGRLVLPVDYDQVLVDGTGNFYVSANGKCGMLDKQGSEIIPVKYSSLLPFQEDLAAVLLNNKWGFVNQSGKLVITPQYDGAASFSDGVAAVAVNKKVGFINKEGKMVIQPQFDGVVEPFYKGKAIVVLAGKEIYIDAAGKEIK